MQENTLVLASACMLSICEYSQMCSYVVAVVVELVVKLIQICKLFLCLYYDQQVDNTKINSKNPTSYKVTSYVVMESTGQVNHDDCYLPCSQAGL